MTDPDEGTLPADLAAELEQAAIGHKLGLVELDEAFRYRDAIIARAAERMRFRLCDEAEIERMVTEALAVPPCVWIAELRAPGDFGPWDD